MGADAGGASEFDDEGEGVAGELPGTESDGGEVVAVEAPAGETDLPGMAELI